MTVPELAEQPAASTGEDSPALYRPAASRVWSSADALILGAFVLAGFLVRLRVAHQSLFADELSTYWIVATHSLGGVMSLMYGNSSIPHAEITPPLMFLASWLTSQLGHAPELVRAPSLIAGTLSIPLVYALGRRTFGRPAALLAAALTALSPFMIYYSAEARSYAVMIFFVTLSTLSLLLALDSGRRRWWVLYALAECAAFYAHYTCIFALAAQLGWVLWTQQPARRPALLATLGAIVLLLPWVPGLINDYDSPTTKILSALSPFTFTDVRLSLEHWSVGFPYVVAGGLAALPGIPALTLLGAAALLTLAGLGGRIRALGSRGVVDRVSSRHVLVFLLLLSVPVGEALQSAVSTHTFGVRNLAASWPALALAGSGLVICSGRRVRMIAAALALVAGFLAAVKMLSTRWARPDFRASAQFIERHAKRGDVVIDSTGVLSPGPLTGLDLVLRSPGPEIRAAAPAERQHPFGLLDPITSVSTAVAQAATAAHGRRIFVATFPRPASIHEPFPPAYHLIERQVYHDFVPLTVEVWGTAGSRVP